MTGRSPRRSGSGATGAWDPGRNDFVWVAGPCASRPGATWVAGRWMRDADGWYRVSGFWNRPRDRTGLVTTSTSTPVARPPGGRPDLPPTAPRLHRHPAPGPDPSPSPATTPPRATA